ncbi:MAG: hypothetical protein INR71_05470, partial [Terriglobus roseus]|nr:hypothetical protein [Terriglobus roseus]
RVLTARRSRDDRLDVKPPSTTTTHHDESSTPKRARLSASPPPQESQPQSPPPPPESRLGSPPPPEAQPESHQPPPPETRSESPPLNPHGLPPLQSPIRVAPIPYGLPPMLSPTLPAAVELELSRLSEHARNQPSTPSSAEKPAKKNPSTADPLANKIANSLKKSEVAIQRLSQLEDRQSKHDTAKEAVNTSHGNLLSESDIDAPRPARRQRFIVKLKYGKRHRKVVEQILRLPSKNSRGVPQARSESATRMEKSASQDTHRSDVKVPVTSHPLKTTIGKEREPPKIRKEIVNNGKSTTEKRKHQDDDARDQQGPKRQKALSGADSDKQPSTPLPAHAYSPSVGPQSAKSSAQKVDRLSATPRKDLRAVQMQRSTSGDSHVRTPQASGSTPGPRPTSAHNGRATEVEQWSALSKKYNDLGRKIKYEAQASAGKSNPSNADRKRSAVLALQCILSYVLAYHCQDTSSRLRHHACSLENTWISLLPMWGTFQRICQPFPQLDGLRFYLGVVIRNAIGLIMADRINIAKKAGADQPDAAPLSRHGSSDAPTPTPSASGSSASGVPPADWIRDNIIESGRCSREAAIKLSLKDLIAAFPATWAGSAPDAERPHVGSLDRDQDALLGGKYWLPLSADTTPVQGVRFGLRLLQEWAAKEGLDMEFALKSA